MHKRNSNFENAVPYLKDWNMFKSYDEDSLFYHYIKFNSFLFFPIRQYTIQYNT